MRRRRFLVRAGSALLVLAASFAPAGGQSSCREWLEVNELVGPYADFARTAEILGRAPARHGLLRRTASDLGMELCADSIPWRRRVEAAPSADGEPTLRILPVVTTQRYNSAYPRDRNNGAVWAGRGWSSGTSAGFRARWGPVSAQLRPAAMYQQNRPLPTRSSREKGFSRYIYPSHGARIDWPQRFGDDPYGNLEPGQSYLRVDAWALAAGVSTENLWWGPALDQPLLLGNTAPGFPHFFLGTGRPVDIGIGKLSGTAFWGRLTESDYFDSDPDNDHRLFAGLGLVLEPRGVRGLALGVARTYMRPLEPDGLGPLDFLAAPYDALIENRPDDNELLGVFARWTFPDAGLEVYAEWAREDHWADVQDLLAEPDHTLGYTVGLQKATELRGNWLRIHGELFRLQVGPNSMRSARAFPTFYTHDKMVQGYTHRGQLLGASVGPGSSGERLAADLFMERGLLGVFAERTFYDDDAYFTEQLVQGRTRGDNRDRELALGVRHLIFFGDFDVHWSLGWAHRTNRVFMGLYRPGDGDFPEDNWTVEIGGAWRPALVIR